VMCGFFGSYDLLLLGSLVEASGEDCDERYSGSTAIMPAVG